MVKRLSDELQSCLNLIRELSESLGDESEQTEVVLRELLARAEAARTALLRMVAIRDADAEPTNLVEVLERAARFALATRDLDIEWQLDTPLAIVAADPGRLWDVVLNLILTAVDAKARSLVIRLESTEKRHRVEIEDDGTDVAAADRARLFDSTAVGRSRRSLNGARDIIESFGGDIELTAPVEKPGVRLVISLPAVTLL